MPDTQAAKAALRERLVTQRRALSPADLVEAAEAIADHVLAEPDVRTAGTLTLYVGVGDEPGTGMLLERLHEAGRRVLLPIVVRADGPGLDLDWAEYDGPESLAPARFGLLEPVTPPLGRDAVADAGVLLVPGMAVSPAGVRIGKGAGCYDRAIGRAPGVPSYVLLHRGETGLDVPAEPHDARVTAAVTPDGVTRLAG